MVGLAQLYSSPLVPLPAAVMVTVASVADGTAAVVTIGVASTAALPHRYHCGQYGAVESCPELHSSEPDVMKSSTYRPGGMFGKA